MTDDKIKTVADELREKRRLELDERRQKLLDRCRAIVQPRLRPCGSCGGTEWGMDVVSMTVAHYTPTEDNPLCGETDESWSFPIPALGVFCRGCGRLTFHALRFLLPEEGKRPTLRLVQELEDS